MTNGPIELRKRIHAGLNKGEARNALARAAFFNRLGELRDRTYENQQHRASGLNLVVAAIALWNTVYLERAIRALQERSYVCDRKSGREVAEPRSLFETVLMRKSLALRHAPGVTRTHNLLIRSHGIYLRKSFSPR